MSIKNTQFGTHENVTFLEFGTGDILITKGREQDEVFESLLMLSQSVPNKIGAETDEYKGKTTNELPELKVVMKFTKPESITALIRSLVELQKQVFEGSCKPNSEPNVQERDASKAEQK